MKKLPFYCGLGLMPFTAIPNYADPQLEEVVITAQKREQNLQDTPIAVSAFDAEAIEDRQVNDLSDLSGNLPNVQITPSPGTSSSAVIAIRGSTMINPAITWEPAVSMYVNGVPVTKSIGGLFDTLDIERIEVLRGPQGTLYGKNTSGGAINIVSRKPAEAFQGSLSVSAGNYGYLAYGASIDSGRIADSVSMTLSYKNRQRDGLYDNVDSGIPGAGVIQTNEFKALDSEAALVSLHYQPSDVFEARYNFDYSKKDNTPSFGQFDLGYNAENGQYYVPETVRLEQGSLDGAVEEKAKSQGHALNLDYQINDQISLKSITGHRALQYDDTNDYDGSQFVGFNARRQIDFTQTTQEIQLLGQFDTTYFVAGIFAMDEQADAYNPFTLGTEFGPVEVKNYYGVDATSMAAFGQLDWDIGAFTLTLGGRYTQEKKEAYINHPDDFVAPFESENSKTWRRFTPLVGVNYNVDDATMLYTKVSQGFKAGGFNGEAESFQEAQQPYDAEVVTAYEAGAKTQLLNQRLQLNSAVFFNDIRDMQISNFTGLYSIINNAGAAEVFGVEIESLFAMTEDFSIGLNYGYLQTDIAEYKTVVPTGDPANPTLTLDITDEAQMPYAPEHKVSLSVKYDREFSFASLSAFLGYDYQTSVYFYAEEPKSTLTKANAYGLLNGRIALLDIEFIKSTTFEVALWGKNLTDEEYRLNGIPGVDATNTFVAGINYYGDPRTFGMDVKLSF